MKTAAVTTLYLALTLVLAYPLSIHPASRVLSDAPDTHLFLWTLAWDAHAFTHQPFAIFDANIFHPQRHTLAYSENLIGTALIAAPIVWLTDNYVFAMNVVTLLSCVLCGLGAYTLARSAGLATIAAGLSGLVFAFTPPRFFRLSQLHLTTVQWVPFGLALLHTYLDRGDKLDLRLAVMFFTLQAFTSGHGAVFLALGMLCLVSYRAALGEPLAFGRRLRDFGAVGVLLLAPALWIAWPYRLVQADVGLRRPLEDWAPTPASFLASPTHLHAWVLSLLDPHVNDRTSAYLFPGYVVLLLAAAGLWAIVARGGVQVGNDLKRTEILELQRAGTRVARPLAAVVLETAALASLGLAVWVTVFGAVRVRYGTFVVLSVRQAWRPWACALVGAALRLALVRRAPLDLRPRVSRLLGAFARSRAAWRRWSAAYRHDAILPYVWSLRLPSSSQWAHHSASGPSCTGSPV